MNWSIMGATRTGWLFFFYVVSVCNCAKILAIFYTPAYSHFIVGEALLKALANRGHQVTVISGYPQIYKFNNYKDVPVHLKKEIENFFDVESFSFSESIQKMYTFGADATEQILRHKNVQDLMKSGETFDLIIAEQFINEAFLGFASYYSAPIILLSSLGSSGLTNHLFGNVAPSSYIPSLFLRSGGPMEFFTRIQNLIVEGFDNIYKWTVVMPRQNMILKKYFPDAPDLYNLMYNASLVFLNSNVFSNEPVPHVPSMVEVGGIHVAPPKSLPTDLQNYLNDAIEGVVYISMGSNLKSVYFPLEKRDALIRSFSKLKLKVLWKWEEDDVPGRPSNVKIGKWLPQQDILAHPNVHVFITHGGLLSTIETIHFGVPIIGIPIFLDQIMNIERAVSKGFAVHVPFKEISEEKLDWALNEIINNSMYRENVQRLSIAARDVPLSPLDNAIFWTEYVIRHKGAHYFQCGALSLMWYQYYFLDIVFFIVIFCVITFIIYYIIFKGICKSKLGEKTKTL